MTYPPATLWETALRALHAFPRAWSDSRIAEALSDLSDAAITHLAATGWSRDNVEKAMVPGAGGKEWTKKHICRYRARHNLPGNKPLKRGKPKPGEVRSVLHFAAVMADRASVLAQGWEHLLTPHPDLRAREADILTALHEHGPLSKAQIAAIIGHTLRRRSHHGSWTGSLLRRGLIVMQLRVYCPRQTPTRFMLAPDIAPHAGRLRRHNGIDRQMENLNVQ